MGLLPSYYVRLALPWAWLAVGSGLDSVTNFFFFFFYKQICIAILGNGGWFGFAFYGIYLFFPTNDMTVD